MKEKIFGLVICMLFIATAIPVIGTANDQPGSEAKNITLRGTVDTFYFGIIKNLNTYYPLVCTFDAIIVVKITRINGLVTNRQLPIGGSDQVMFYDHYTGTIRPHFICCTFTAYY